MNHEHNFKSKTCGFEGCETHLICDCGEHGERATLQIEQFQNRYKYLKEFRDELEMKAIKANEEMEKLAKHFLVFTKKNIA